MASSSPQKSASSASSSASSSPNTPPKQDTMGVYLRNDETTSNSSQKELDVLWSQDTPRTIVPHIKEDHHPLLTFIAGLATGAILTGLLFWLFNSRPLTPITDAVRDSDPAAIEAPLEKEGGEANQNAITTPGEGATPATGNGEAPTPAAPSSSVSAKGSTYQVKSGDTLGDISDKFYGSTSPEYVKRIVEANNMKSKHQLSLGQELIIPPKNY